MRPKSVLAGIAMLVGATALVVGCVAVLNLGPHTDGNNGDCGIEQYYDGARYQYVNSPSGDRLREPRGVRVVGEAELTACEEPYGQADAYEVAGVSPKVAVVIDGYLYVRRGAPPPRRLLRASERPILCMTPAVFRGMWRDLMPPTGRGVLPTNDDASKRRPYRLQLDATGGDHPAFGRWQRLYVTVLITSETGLSPEDERKATYGLIPTEVATHCDGDRFVADQIDLLPVASESP